MQKIRKNMDKITEMTEIVDKLKLLLDDPQPGLYSWWLMVGEKVNELKEIY